MWISPKFHLQVIRAYDASMTEKFKLPNFTDPAEAAIAWAVEYKAKQAALAQSEAALAQIERDKPKVEVANCLTEKTDSYYIRDWVKRMKDEYKLIVGERAVIDWLIGQHYIYRDELRRLTPYAKYESNGRNYFTVNSELINNRLERVIQITGKGILALTKKVIKTFSGTNIKNHTNLELWESRY
jgi:phage antirepressor YoqD-like protein